MAHYDVGTVRIHKRKTLPHWDAEIAIQFVTIDLLPGLSLTRERAAALGEIVVRAARDRYLLLAWCVMPDHLHVVFEPSMQLAAIVRTWKRLSAWHFGGGNWWQKDYFDRLIHDKRELSETIDYVMYNPEAAGLTDWDFRAMYPEAIAAWC